MSNHCHLEPIQKTASAEELATLTETWLVVSGMGCPTCERRVENALLTMYGVTEAYADHFAGTTKIIFNPTLISVQRLLDAVENAGKDGRHHYTAAQLC